MHAIINNKLINIDKCWCHDPLLKDKSGYTAMMYAIKHGNV